jgi:hypothetical protein
MRKSMSDVEWDIDANLPVYTRDYFGMRLVLDVHKRNNLRNTPVCFQNDPPMDVLIMTEEIDEVTCVMCLRMLARDAVIYGNARKPRRE